MTDTTLAQRLRAHCEGDRESLSGIPLMAEAADELDRLTEANKALEAKAEEALADWSKAATNGIADFKRAESAEAKLAKVEALWHETAEQATTNFDSWMETIADRDRISAELAEARRVIEPFSDIAGEMFSRGWDASNVALALDNPDDPHRVTAGDFFTARDFLASEGKP